MAKNPHTNACIGRAVALAFENGAVALTQALDWVSTWENDGGLDNYGACTCNP